MPINENQISLAIKLAKSLPRGTYRRLRENDQVTNYLGYRNENNELWVMSDNLDDLPQATCKIGDFFAMQINEIVDENS